jgi:hypothetical protein
VKFGADAFFEALTKSQHPTEFQLGLLKSEAGNGEAGLVAYVNNAVSVLLSLDDPAEREVYVRAVAKESNVSVDTILGKIAFAESGRLSGFGMAELPAVRTKTDLPEGLMASYRNLLYYMATHTGFYEVIRDAVSPDEILLPAFKMLHSDIRYKRERTALPCHPADFTFENHADRDCISTVFANPMLIKDEEILKKSLNQWVKIIKEEYIKAEMRSETAQNDPETLKMLSLSLKDTDKSYI